MAEVATNSVGVVQVPDHADKVLMVFHCKDLKALTDMELALYRRALHESQMKLFEWMAEYAQEFGRRMEEGSR